MKDEPNPYAAPKSQEAAPLPSARSKLPASAQNLELKIQVPVPPVCVKCGTDEKIQRREETFTWSVLRRRSFGLWYVLLGWLGGLGAMLLDKDNERTAKLFLPLCRECSSRWSIAMLLAKLSWGGVLLVLVLAHRWVDASGVLILFIASLGAAALLAYDLKKQSLQALYIDDEIIVLTGSKPIAVEKVTEALAAARAKSKPKKRKEKPSSLSREPDAIEDRMGYDPSSETTLSLDGVPPEERDAGR